VDVNDARRRKPLGEPLREAGLQQPAQSPSGDVDRRAISGTGATRREMLDRHTLLVSWDGSGLTELVISGKNLRRSDANMS
jgi:hypothetical protein